MTWGLVILGGRQGVSPGIHESLMAVGKGREVTTYHQSPARDITISWTDPLWIPAYSGGVSGAEGRRSPRSTAFWISARAYSQMASLPSAMCRLRSRT